MNKKLDKLATKLAKAFLQNKVIAPLPSHCTKNLISATKFRKLCESKVKKPIQGFKAAGTGIPLLKKLKEKEPFYAPIYKHNILKNNKSIKVNKYVLGIEVEVCYLIKKSFFDFKKRVNKNNFKKFISHIAPCIEVVGYRQRKKGNVKFVLGPKKKFKNNNVKNLKTSISNSKINQHVKGNTNTVYVNPMNSLRFVLSKIQKDKIKHKDDFYVFTGSSVGVVPILGKGIYKAKIDKLGSVSAKII
jgi:2-keto-4-pentenoate hydratase